ncbi:hypothetical protein BSI_11990 [Bacillus inaquosorum KCTC 13429]|uniref:Transposase n=1 Tax=Bacillus inaquosorum KCTC 13429 TaxID=1236548 RepID=A0A9W5PDY6_9BACI|nr:hypothetical protein BSI_11990 [Bacillus inaquosorum KCTC 13429]
MVFYVYIFGFARTAETFNKQIKERLEHKKHVIGTLKT